MLGFRPMYIILMGGRFSTPSCGNIYNMAACWTRRFSLLFAIKPNIGDNIQPIYVDRIARGPTCSWDTVPVRNSSYETSFFSKKVFVADNNWNCFVLHRFAIMMHHPNMHHQAMSGHPPQHLGGPQGMPAHHQLPPHQMHRENRHVTMAR